MTGERLLPNVGLTNRWTPGTSGWALAMDGNIAALDGLLFLTVLSASTVAPPGAPAAGDRYIVPVGAMGAWAGKDGQVAVELDAAWVFHTPKPGWRARVLDLVPVSDMVFTGAVWAGPVVPYDFQVFRYTLPLPPEPILSLSMSRLITFPIGLLGSRATLKVATTAAKSLQIMQNVTVIGSVDFAAGATAGTFTFAVAVAFLPGDILEIMPPAVADATLKGLRIALVGYR